MSDAFLAHLSRQLADLRTQGLEKRERLISSPQSARITADGRAVVNLCANNYLGLADDPRLAQAAKAAIDAQGFGLASVRFICGTQDRHRELERRLAAWLGTDDAILFSSCFDANGGLFEALFGAEDAVISDALNHASIIDGIRLCKAQRLRYANNDHADLEKQLVAAKDARFRLIATDGVFSMDGIVADLKGLCALAGRHDALVMVDDSHAVGFIGPKGRGTPALHGVAGRVDILTGTFGKALGGAAGGYVAGRQAIVDWLRQRARPYLFSNTVAPAIVGATLAAIGIVEGSDELRQKLERNATRWRAGLTGLGFRLVPGAHPIVPVLLGDAALAGRFAQALFERGVYAVAFSYPVVPMGQARIRTQMSAALGDDDLEHALTAFAAVGRELQVIA
ncbi:MAG TPA: glycine C-acetyltransferase [Planctomycetota bacterium]|nr:glycine C-acetyltransferase [Planctomycetota bacterium]